MKIKHLMIVCLILAVLTVGAVNASENVTDDQLTVDDEAQIQEASQNDAALESAGENEIAQTDSQDAVASGEAGYDGITVNFTSGCYYTAPSPFPDDDDNGDDSDPKLLAEVSLKKELTGKLRIYLGGELYYDKEIKNGTIVLNSLDKKPAPGKYLAEAKYFDGVNETVVASQNISIGYTFYAANDEDSNFASASKVRWVIVHPDDISGDLYVTVNGKTQKVSYKKGSFFTDFILDTSNLKINEKYTLKLELRNDPFYPYKKFEGQFTIYPNVGGYYYMSVGEKGYLSINLPKSYSGTLKLYKADPKDIYRKTGKAIASVKVKNGMALLPVSFSKAGVKNYVAEYVSGKYSYDGSVTINVLKNNNKISSSVKSNTVKLDKKAVVYIKGPKGFAKSFEISVDGVLYKTVKLNKKGKAKVSVKFETTGKHSIKVLTHESKFHSNTFTINVKKPDVVLKLNKVTVKVGKKVALKSTLKIKGKAKKGLKIKFKFNGKTYKAKTNKKGIAKVSIPKKVTSLLKSGQKVKYQATYGKVTTKLTANVI